MYQQKQALLCANKTFLNRSFQMLIIILITILNYKIYFEEKIFNKT